MEALNNSEIICYQSENGDQIQSNNPWQQQNREIQKVLSQKCRHHPSNNAELLHLISDVETPRICLDCVQENEISSKNYMQVKQVLSSSGKFDVLSYPVLTDPQIRKIISTNNDVLDFEQNKIDYFFKDLSQSMQHQIEQRKQAVKMKLILRGEIYQDTMNCWKDIMDIQSLQGIMFEDNNEQKLVQFIQQHISNSASNTQKIKEMSEKIASSKAEFSLENPNEIKNQVCSLLDQIDFYEGSSPPPLQPTKKIFNQPKKISEIPTISYKIPEIFVKDDLDMIKEICLLQTKDSNNCNDTISFIIEKVVTNYKNISICGKLTKYLVDTCDQNGSSFYDDLIIHIQQQFDQIDQLLKVQEPLANLDDDKRINFHKQRRGRIVKFYQFVGNLYWYDIISTLQLKIMVSQLLHNYFVQQDFGELKEKDDNYIHQNVFFEGLTLIFKATGEKLKKEGEFEKQSKAVLVSKLQLQKTRIINGKENYFQNIFQLSFNEILDVMNYTSIHFASNKLKDLMAELWELKSNDWIETKINKPQENENSQKQNPAESK